MTSEGVGETSSLADALSAFGAWITYPSAHATKLCAQSKRRAIAGSAFAGGRFEALVAGAPIFRPLHSLFDLAGGLGVFPFGAAFLLPLARGELARGRRLLRLRLCRLGGRGLRGLRRALCISIGSGAASRRGRQQGGEDVSLDIASPVCFTGRGVRALRPCQQPVGRIYKQELYSSSAPMG